MATLPELKEVTITIDEFVATVEIHRPPHNFFDFDLIRDIADAYQALDSNPDCRAIVLCSEGKNFCAGANFSAREDWGKEALTAQARQLYVEATRLFAASTPVIAAIQGAAVGGGLGLAMSADFRVTCAEGRFSANFARLGFHQGFGLSVSLPRIIGQQQAAWMLMSGCRIKGEQAVAMGLAEELVPIEKVRIRASEMAREIAQSAPLAVAAIRKTLRQGLAKEISAITDHELEVQDQLRESEDFQEGLRATAERRLPDFKGH